MRPTRRMPARWKDKQPPGFQRGFLLIMAVVLIVIAALLLTVMMFLGVTGTESSASHSRSGQALFIAESGLERGARTLLSPVPAERVDCTDVTGDVNLTNIAFGDGRFTLTGGTTFYPNNANNTLRANIGVADAIIPLNDLTGFAPMGGRVLIDRETIDYSGVSSDTAVCGGAALTPCLTGAQRGRDGTVAATHASGTRVGQFQCNLQSQGGVPDMAGASSKRTLRTGVQIQEAWAVGNLGGTATNENLNAIHCTSSSNCWAVADNGVIVYWNGSAWTQDPFVAAENLNGVYCADAANCIAVGDPGGAAAQRPYTLRLSSGAWNAQNNTALSINQPLNGIFCFAGGTCWAVGDPDNAVNERPLILYWNGANWTRNNSNLNINRALNGVTCTAANNCWAVGDAGTGATERPLILWWDGANWQRRNSSLNVNQNLNAVHCFDANNCMAVGDNGVSYFWNGANWTARNTGTGENLNGVWCMAVNSCFAVGDNGTLLQWSGGANWAAVTSGTTENLNAINCTSASDCFAVGDNGTVLRWNGTSWSSTVTPALLRWNGTIWSDASGLLAAGINRDLRSVTVLSYTDGWVVGETGGNAVAPCPNNRARIGRWNASSWACDASSPSNRNLNSVSGVSYNDAWAVGAGGSIVRWNGAAWNEQNATQAITGRELHAVHALGATEVWVTGRDENQGGRTCANNTAIVLRWNGAWSCQNTGAARRRYRAMFMYPDGTDAGTQPDDGWIVGDRAGDNFSIFRWNNPVANQWNNQSFLDATNRERLNSVTMLDTDGNGLGDDGWAVGQLRNNNLTILRWNRPCAGGAATGAWAVCSFNPGTAALRQNLNAVSCVHDRDCWAVGNNGLILHWDGAAWAVHTQSGGMPGALTTANLNSLSILGPKTRPQAAWSEIFP